MSDPLPAPAFNLQYNTPLTDIGKGYAEGITKAGESIAGAIGNVLGGGINPKTGEIQQGIYGQNRTADDILSTMHENKILSDEAYKSIAGKSLGAKQTMMGQFWSQYEEQQKQERAIALEKVKGAVDIGTAHAKTQDLLRYNTDPSKVPYRSNVQTPPVQQTNQVVPPVTSTTVGHVPWKPGSKVVQVTKDGQTSHAIQTPDGQLIEVNP